MKKAISFFLIFFMSFPAFSAVQTKQYPTNAPVWVCQPNDTNTGCGAGSAVVTSVSGAAPVTSSGGTTPQISMAAADASTDGYLKKGDWSTFNAKQPAGSYLTTAVTSINSDTTAAQTLAVGTTGTDFAIANNGTGTHTFNLPDASTTARGVVNTDGQSFTGVKTFVTPPIFTKGIDATAKVAFDVSNISTSSTRTMTIPDRSLTFDNITTSSTTNGTGFVKGNGSVISFDNSTYLTSYTETDPIAKAVNGILKSNGSTLSAATADTDYATPTLAKQLGVDINRYGFLNRNETTITFDGVDTLTLASVGANWSYYRAGIKYTITGNKTKQLASPMVDGTLYYVYIDATDGTLSVSTSSWTLNDTKVPVATIYWNNTLTPKYVKADERHTVQIDRAWHREHHMVEGTQASVFGTVSGLTAGSDTPSTKTFGIAGTTIFDEDLKFALTDLADPDGATAVYPILYRTSATTYAWALSDMPFKYTTTAGPVYGYGEYDLNGTSTPAGSSQFFNSYIYASNAVSAAEANPEISTSAVRYFIMQGRGVYTSAALATAEKPLVSAGMPISEGVFLYQLTWATTNRPDTVKGRCRFVSIQQVSANNVTTSVISATTHNGLAGLDGGTINEYYHMTAAEYAAAQGVPSTYLPLAGGTLTGDLAVGSVTAGKSITLNSTLGTEISPAINSTNWTVGAGWAAVTSVLAKDSAGTGTATPITPLTPTASKKYKIVIVVDSITAASYSSIYADFGGSRMYMGTTSGTKTFYLNASDTSTLTIYTTTASRIQISSISIKEMTISTGSATVDGDLNINAGGLVINGTSGKNATNPSIWFKDPTDTSSTRMAGTGENLSFYVGTNRYFNIGTGGNQADYAWGFGTSPTAMVDVLQADRGALTNTNVGNVNIWTSDSGLAADKGGSLTLGGRTTATGGYRNFAGIRSGKLNNTSANESGYLSFWTNNAGTLTEGMRIDSTGAVILPVTAPFTTGTIELGHASDTTLARVSAGVASIEGKNITLVGGTDVVVADGGTGLSAVADGSILAANTADTLSAVTWHSAGDKILTNKSGTISWEDATTSAFDATAQDALTWSDGANASNVWTFDVSGTDTTMTFGNGTIAVNGTFTATNLSGTNTGDNAANTSIAATKLDDFATPDNNTDLDANTTNHGLLLKATAPASGLYNYVGITNGETAYTNKALFDATVPSTQAFGDSASAGTATVTARRDHKHAMMAAPTTVSGNAGTVTHADAGGDTTTWVSLGTAATGSLVPATDAGITYNATTDQLQLGEPGTDGSLKIFSEDGATDHSTIFNPGTQTQDIIYTLPVDDGDAGEQLQTNGSGVLSWEAAGGAAAAGWTSATGYIKTTTDGDNIIIGGATAVGTSGASVLAIEVGTAPSTSPADMVQVYTADVAGAEATGGTITRSGGKTIHTFTSSGTFTPATSGNVSVLVVGAGGGGSSGGGGGGGVQVNTSYAVTGGSGVTVTINSGGAGTNPATGTAGSDGGTSVFGTITANGGGGGGAINVNGRNGGSGGGCGATNDAGRTGGTGSQGGNGGDNGTLTSPYYGSGGGGAAPDKGDNSAAGVAGHGGAGYTSSISGSSVNYAGGGGGNSYSDASDYGLGADGGGNGGGSGNGANGTDGLGGGGGGAKTGLTGGTGGKGVVIVSYDTPATLAELRVRDEGGNITTLSPHNFKDIPSDVVKENKISSDGMAWSYHSEKDGKSITVDMFKAVQILEKLSGEKLIYTSGATITNNEETLESKVTPIAVASAKEEIAKTKVETIEEKIP